MHCVWKFEFVVGLSKREVLKKTGGRKAIYGKLRSKKFFFTVTFNIQSKDIKAKEFTCCTQPTALRCPKGS